MNTSTDDLVHKMAEKSWLQDLTERDMLEATAIVNTLSLEKTMHVRGTTTIYYQLARCADTVSVAQAGSQTARARPQLSH